MATRNIGKLAAQLVANDDGFVKVLERVDRGLTNLEKKGRKTNASLSNAFSVGAVIGVTIQAIDMLGSRMTGVVSKVTQGLEEMNRTAEDAAILGLGVGEIQEVVGAFKLANVEADTTRKIVEDLIRTMANARAGEDSAVAQLERIGIAADDLRGLNTREILSRVADGLADIESPAEKAAAAYELFGRQAHNVLRVLGDGSSGLAAAINEARSVGGVLSDVDIEKAVKYDEAMDRLMLSTEGLAKRIGAELAPALTVLLDRLTAIAAELDGSALADLLDGIGSAWNGARAVGNAVVGEIGTAAVAVTQGLDAANQFNAQMSAETQRLWESSEDGLGISKEIAEVERQAVADAKERQAALDRVNRIGRLVFVEETAEHKARMSQLEEEAAKREQMLADQASQAATVSELWRENMQNLGATMNDEIDTSLSKLTGLGDAMPNLKADLIMGGSAEAQRIARMPQGPQDNPTLKAAQQTAENTAAIARNTVPSSGVVNYFLP